MNVTSEMIHPSLRFWGRFWGVVLGDDLPDPKPAGDTSLVERFALIPAKGVVKQQVSIPRDGLPDLRMLVVKPKRPTRLGPAVLWIHGGGFAGGLPEMNIGRMTRLARDEDAVVVAPAYRLSGEAPWPAARDDCYSALLWLARNAREWGARDDQIVVVGESAGGGLTAQLSLFARDRGEVNIAFQAPLYPMIDDRVTESSADNDAPGWNAKKNQKAWRWFLGELYGGDVPAYAAPARAEDLSGLPPTITFVGTVDPFFTETVTYVERLRQAGVEAKLHLAPGAWHGSDILVPWAAPSRESMAWFRREFHTAAATYFAPQPSR